MVFLCGVGCCITWPILFPVNATGGGSGKQLDLISFSNVVGKDRMYAHAAVAWVFLGFVMFTISRERVFLIGLRQAYMLSKANAARLSSRTVLFLAVPKEATHEDNIQRIFGKEAKRHWTVSNINDLEDLDADRKDKAMMLESAEVELIKNLNKAKQKGQSKTPQNGDVRPEYRPSVPLVGSKVDKIRWSRRVVTEKTAELQEAREKYKGEHHEGSAVFVEFKTQAAAQRACQHITFHNPLRIDPRYIGVIPKEVIWKNLTISPASRMSKYYLATAFVVAIVILWSIPIGIIGTLTNIQYLTERVHFLRFLYKLPDPVLGLLTGFLPAYLMSEFVSYVPKFFRIVAKASGEPTNSQAEIRTQSWYMIFQVIQVFLITTFSSGAAAVAVKIAQKPHLGPVLLAQNLPKASNFYLAYFILQGTASAAKNILNYSDLFEYLFYYRFLSPTPRDKYAQYVRMKGLSFGSVYPKFTNMAIIAIAYSCIAPLVLGFATIGLFLYYLSYRYDLMFVIQVKIDTKGECYSRALQQMMIGVYISELCLLGLFGTSSATGPVILMAVLLIGTVIFHVGLDRQLTPLETYLPTDLTDTDEEERPLLDAEAGLDDEDRAQSHVLAHGHKARVPDKVLTGLATFLEPHIFESHKVLQTWFADEQADELPEYTDDEVKNAYVNPALTSKTPKLWLPKDEAGVSKVLMEENEKEGIQSTDEGAALDEKGEVVWKIDDLNEVPVFKRPDAGPQY